MATKSSQLDQQLFGAGSSLVRSAIPKKNRRNYWNWCLENGIPLDGPGGVRDMSTYQRWSDAEFLSHLGNTPAESPTNGDEQRLSVAYVLIYFLAAPFIVLGGIALSGALAFSVFGGATWLLNNHFTSLLASFFGIASAVFLVALFVQACRKLDNPELVGQFILRTGLGLLVISVVLGALWVCLPQHMKVIEAGTEQLMPSLEKYFFAVALVLFNVWMLIPESKSSAPADEKASTESELLEVS